MVKGRMIQIIRYLNKERMASYREIADALDIKERLVRYDVDSINDELSLRKLALIEKYPKGMLFVPDDLDLTVLITTDAEFVFSPGERVAIIRLYILFGLDRLNIRKLTEQLSVSRRSIQNDIDAVQQELKAYQMNLEYDRKYRLTGESVTSYRLRSNELKQYVGLLYKKEHGNGFEAYITTQLGEIFLPAALSDILTWVQGILERTGWVFSDESFQWYVSNVLTFTWYLVKRIPLPQTHWSEEGEIDESLHEYEGYLGRELTGKEKGILSGFARYTNRYVNLDVNLSLVTTEDIVLRLVQRMGEELHMDFTRDGILVKGLLNHIVPLLERVRARVQLHGEAFSLIPDGYQYVYHTLDGILQESPVLGDLTENEKVYLAIYFMGSLRRMQRERYQVLLLICGYGYGTTAMVKDALLNEYQVYVKECIPAYKVARYQGWPEVDAVVSTVKVELPVEKPFAQVHVIFEKEDYVKLDLLGLRRKNVLTGYFAIQRRLDFLSSEDKTRVMDVIREELGFKEVRMPAKYYKLTDLLGIDGIRCVDHVEDWRDAVRTSTRILEELGCIDEAYYKNIIQGMEIQGFYSVTDNKFALLHGSENAGIKVSCMSLLITGEPVAFGNKRASIVFCLASKDKKEHVPAVIRLMRMVETTDLIEKLKICTTQRQAMDVIEKCEKEVEACYQF